MSKARDLANAAALYAPLINPTFTKIGGDEGGEIRFAKPDTNTTLAADVTFDSYQDKLRIFESGGNVRGAYLNLAGLSNGVGSELVASPPQSGNSGKYLSTNGSVTSWSAAGGMIELASGSLPTGAAVLTLSSISASYKDLRLIIRNPYPLGSFKLNNDSSANAYSQVGINAVNNSISAQGELTTQIYGAWNSIVSTNQSNTQILNIYDYANTVSFKMFDFMSIGITTSPSGGVALWSSNGAYRNASAINRIDLSTGVGNFNGGTYILYGVN